MPEMLPEDKNKSYQQYQQTKLYISEDFYFEVKPPFKADLIVTNHLINNIV